MSSERAVPFASKPPPGWDDHVSEEREGEGAPQQLDLVHVCHDSLVNMCTGYSLYIAQSFLGYYVAALLLIFQLSQQPGTVVVFFCGTARRLTL